ncbi:MAG: type II toxin-antitoxin system PemK/MazF family toxin [Terriglobales bacterium]
MSWKRGTKPHGWYPRRGDVCLFDLDKERPALVVSTDALNRFSLDLCIVPISKIEHKQFSLRPKLKAGEGGLDFESWVKCDQVTTVEKERAVYPALGFLTQENLRKVESSIRTALELPEKK